jgi:hypothetical protein
LIKATPKEPYSIDDVVDTIKKQERSCRLHRFQRRRVSRATLEELRHDLQAVKAATRKPIIVYTTGTNWLR